MFCKNKCTFSQIYSIGTLPEYYFYVTILYFLPFLRGNEASFPQQGSSARPVRADQPQRRLPVAAVEPLPVPQPTDLSVRPPSQRGGFPVGPAAAYHSHHYGPPFSSHPPSAPSHHLVRASPSATSLSPSPTGGGLRSSSYDSLSLTGHGAADLGHRYNHQQRSSNDLAPSKSHHHASFPAHTAGGAGVVLAPSGSQASPTGRGGGSGGGGAPKWHQHTGAASQQQPATRPVHTSGGYSSPSRQQSTASSQLQSGGGSHHIASLLPSGGRHGPSSTLGPPVPPPGASSSSRYDSLSASSALQQQQQHQYVTSQSRAATTVGSSPSGPGRLSNSSSSSISSSSSQPVYSSPSGPTTSESSSQQQPPAASKAGGQTVGASGISPISLEQRINKVISQNQAIVETLGKGY
jgi:hypothetical protein